MVETDLTEKMILAFLQKFDEAGKLKYYDNFIILFNFSKHQHSNPSVEAGVKRANDVLPLKIKEFIQSGYSLPPVSPQTGLLNLTYTKPNLTKPNLTKPTDTPPPKKTVWLEFVWLTNEEHSKLISAIGERTTNQYVGALNDYLGSTGRKYKSHYHTILSWWRKDKAAGKVLTDKEFYKKELERLSSPEFVRLYGKELWESI